MNGEQQIEAFLTVAHSYLGTPYTWGGDDPAGIDCSGLVIACAKAVGWLPRKFDTTAEGLFRDYCRVLRPEQTRPGDLVFWSDRSGTRMVHVGILWCPPWSVHTSWLVAVPELYIGAEGGGSWATDPAAAMARNAFVKVRPVASRGTIETRRFGRLGDV